MGEHGAAGGYRCRACGGHDVSVFFELLDTPVLVNFLHTSRDSAAGSPRGDIVLGLCGRCALISNLAFDSSKLSYREGYENPLHHSAVFRSYASELADDLIRRFDLRGKTLIEVGCGDAEFLRILCERGRNRGIGFDPSSSVSLDFERQGVEIVRDLYSEKHSNLRADFILSRQTLEHAENPLDLLTPLRLSIGDRTHIPVFVEVPNASYILSKCFVWDIIYEHVSYFTAHSLRLVLERAGFTLGRVYETFSGQFLCAEAYAHRNGPAGEPPSLDGSAKRRAEDEVARFASAYRRYVGRWREWLDELRKEGMMVALWGAGSKGVSFLNAFDTSGVVSCVVDINPRKQGMFTAGSGHRIVGPSELVHVRPQHVLVVNPVYRHEVEDSLRKLGLAAEVMTL